MVKTIINHKKEYGYSFTPVTSFSDMKCNAVGWPCMAAFEYHLKASSISFGIPMPF